MSRLYAATGALEVVAVGLVLMTDVIAVVVEVADVVAISGFGEDAVFAFSIFMEEFSAREDDNALVLGLAVSAVSAGTTAASTSFDPLEWGSVIKSGADVPVDCS
jgi:hypothetical protein